MKTQVITFLDELEPGMKTLDGFRIESISNGEYLVWMPAHFPIRPYGITMYADRVEAIFLNQEVEVPE